MSNVVLPFLDNMAQYYGLNGPARRPLAWSPFSQMQVPLALPNRQVQVIASDVGTMKELRNQEKEQKENDRATGAAVIGGIATMLLSGGIALVLRNFFNDQKELKKAYEFKNEILPQIEDRALRLELTPIANKNIEILESKTFASRNFLILTGSALACAIAAFAGGILTASWLITAAIVGGVATTALGLFSAVWYATDDTTALPLEMQQKIETLRYRLRV